MRFCEVDRAEQAWRFYTNEKEKKWCDNRNKTNSTKTLIFNNFILFDLLAYPHKYPQMSVCNTVLFLVAFKSIRYQP